MALEVTLYGRPDCHLCAVAREQIGAEIDAAGAGVNEVSLREVDIERDDALFAAYLERIPVVEVAGREVSELELDREAFARTLRQALHTVSP